MIGINFGISSVVEDDIWVLPTYKNKMIIKNNQIVKYSLITLLAVVIANILALGMFNGAQYGITGTVSQSSTFFHLLVSCVVVLGLSPMLLSAKRLIISSEEASLRLRAMEKLAMTDTITGLPNRSLFIDRAQQAFANLNRSDDIESVGLMLLDINGFKQVNTSLGHEIGDIVLKELALRIGRCLRDTDTLARLAADNFAIITTNLVHDSNVIDIVTRIEDAVEKPFFIGDEQRIDIGLSIGIVLAPLHAKTMGEAFKNAEIAMTVARDEGCGYAIYDDSYDQQDVYALSVLGDLKNAIKSDDGQLELYFQPKKNLQTGKCDSMEALIRWNHPERGFVVPDDFIPQAERSGLMHSLTEWVAHNAIRKCKELEDQGIDVGISLNVSTKNLHNSDILTVITKAFTTYNLAPQKVTLEVTETSILTDSDTAIKILLCLNVMGVKISIDDFGTGHSSFLYIKRLKPNEIKIDRSFIIDMLKNDQDQKIVKSTIDLAHATGCTVVAEGVEDKETEQALEDMGCDVIQGYHLAKPLPFSDLTKFLKEDNTND